MNFNVAAFKTGDELKDRSSFDPNAKFGKYSYTRTEKGIADSLPKVNVDLEYTIDNTYKDGEYIKTKYSINISLTAMSRTRGAPILIRRTIFGRKIYLYSRTCLL